MVTNAAAAWVKHGRSQKVVQIDQHGGPQNEKALQPMFSTPSFCNKKGESKMQSVMNHKAQ
jgi:hypothetical protein